MADAETNPTPTTKAALSVADLCERPADESSPLPGARAEAEGAGGGGGGGSGMAGLSIDERDKDVMEAVMALGALGGAGQVDGMRSSAYASTSTPSLTSSSHTSTPATSTYGGSDFPFPAEDPFLARMSKVPIVSGALRAYERGKESSRVVKYGAEAIESGVKAVSAPVLSRLEPQLGQLDEFANRQLDRLGRSYPSLGTTPPREDVPDAEAWDHRRHLDPSLQDEGAPPTARRRTARDRSSSRTRGENEPQQQQQQQHQQVVAASRSRWQTMLVEAGMTAGGISAAVSEESMKSLQYCLQWLQYATAHIEHQITILRDLIAALNQPGGPDALVPASAVRTLGSIKHDLVETVRKVVDIVSTYAGAALPEQARNRVRGFILVLPERWAAAQQQRVQQAPGTGVEQAQAGGVPTTRGAEQAASRVLTLATESLDMLRSCTIVFGESLERAEAWLERLRIVGLQRQREQQRQQAAHHLPPTSATTTSFSTASTSSADTSAAPSVAGGDDDDGPLPSGAMSPSGSSTISSLGRLNLQGGGAGRKRSSPDTSGGEETETESPTVRRSARRRTPAAAGGVKMDVDE